MWENQSVRKTRLTSAWHGFRIFEGSVIVLIASAFRRSGIWRHAVVGTGLTLVISAAVLVFARRTHCEKEIKKNNHHLVTRCVWQSRH